MKNNPKHIINMNTIMLKCSTAIAVILGFSVAANAATTFQIGSVDYTQDFSSYAVDSTLADNGWTLSGASHLTIKAPSAGGSDQTKIVRAANDTTRRVALSPDLDFDPGYQLGDTIFLSAEMRVIDIAESGVAIGLRNSEEQDIAMIRLMDINPPRRFAVRGADATWHASEEQANAFTWYQILLAIELDSEDITKSTGSLFYRDLSNISSVLTAVDDLQGINLGFTETQNPLDIGHIRIELTRLDAEFGNIQIGTGSIIPEQSHIAGVMGLIVLSLAWYFRHRSAKSA